MTLHPKCLILAAAAGLMLSCAPAPAPDTRAADEATIREADEQWAAAAAKNDLDATVAFYADDAVVLAPNAPIATDKKSIREGWVPLVAPGSKISWKATKVEVAKSGDIGYLYGTYELTMKEPAASDKGKMVEVWKKQADGKWKCAVDIFNSDIPLPAPPPAKNAKKK